MSARGQCPYLSSITDVRCSLPDGHPAWDATRFHRFEAAPQVLSAAKVAALLAAIEPTTENVEHVAQALYAQWSGEPYASSWQDVIDDYPDAAGDWREHARAVLAAIAEKAGVLP